MKTHPKILTINFEKPQIFSKTPKPRFQNMKCMKNKRQEAYQVKKILKKLEETLRVKIRVRWGCLGEKRESYRERDWRKWAADRTRRLYRPSLNLDRCRCREGIEEQKYLIKNRSSIDPQGVEKLSWRQELSRSIHQVLRCWRDCDKKKLRKLDR